MAYETYLTQGSSVKCTAAFPHYADGTPHRGQDIVVYTAPPYLGSLMDGKVVRSEYGIGSNASYGNFIIVQRSDGKCCLMAHFSSRAVKVGDRVKKGDILGVMGATGNVTGAHVHIEYQASLWGQLLDPSEISGIPNKIGMYDVTYAGGSTPIPPEPISKDWLLTLCKVKYTNGAERIFPCSSASGFVYFYDDGLYRCVYNDFTQAEKFVANYWNKVTNISSGSLGVFDVSALIVQEY